MQILIIFILSLIASGVIGLTLLHEIFKDISNQFYKINLDMKKSDDYEAKVNVPKTKSRKKEMSKEILGLLTPGVNVVLMLSYIVIYRNNKEYMIDGLLIDDAILPFTRAEEEYYKKNPGVLTGLKFAFDDELDKGEMTISYSDSCGKSYISYIIDENNNKIITSTKGPATKLSIIEQRAKIESYKSDYINEISELFGGNEKIIDIGKTIEISTQDQIDQLEQLKSELLEMNKEETKDNNNHKTLK